LVDEVQHKVGNPVSTISWGRRIKGRISKVNTEENPPTYNIQWIPCGVSLGVMVNRHNIVPRRY
jgi:hypothetical protein